ncbi:MAG: aldose 1-epimerase family protein [Frankiales bacterium]|nr:aldose 1-epimerase family protein [Frankiales bacterium]
MTEVGGGLRSYRVGEVDVLDGFEVTAMCDGARGQALLPWPNRVADGRYSWQGTNHQLPLTEPDRHNAIHGLTRWANWELLELTASGVHLRHRLPTQPGWPFLLRCDLEYTLSGDGLSVRTTLTNVGSEPCPAAAGAHPYLSAGAGLLDTCTLQVPADTFLPTDERGIPVSRRQVEGTEHDFREARLIGGLQLDEAYGDLHRDSKGHAVVRLQRADGSTVELWAGVGYPYLEIFTGDTLTPERRRRGLAVEPMTAPPNALQTGQDLMVLDPQQSLTLQWGVRLG